MKTTLIKRKVHRLLCDQIPRSTTQIMEHINEITRHGTTSQQLGNVLAKDKHIIKAGRVQQGGVRYGTYAVNSWVMAAPFAEQMRKELGVTMSQPGRCANTFVVTGTPWH